MKLAKQLGSITALVPRIQAHLSIAVAAIGLAAAGIAEGADDAVEDAIAADLLLVGGALVALSASRDCRGSDGKGEDGVEDGGLHVD